MTILGQNQVSNALRLIHSFFSQLRKVDASAYSNTLDGGRNKRTMREEKNNCGNLSMYLNRHSPRIHFPQLREDCEPTFKNGTRRMSHVGVN